MDYVGYADLLYTPEFLRTVNLNNFRRHKICLKIGVPKVLLRNNNQTIGLTT
jgi:hypothetical protein